MGRIVGFLHHESGAAAVEYGLIIAGISLAIVMSLRIFSDAFGAVLNLIVDAIK